MELGVQQVFQAEGYAGIGDDEVIAQEVRLAELADQLGFDAVWPVEHHFTDYASCPDNTLYLAHLAARTRRIGLGTGAVIVPWHQPIRIAERLSMLDHLAPGRVRFGMGRGLARREYAGFGIDMDESRDRFDEAARMVLDALDTGFIEGDGPYYPQLRTEIRPRPRATFRDRVYAVGMSPESVDAAADLGTRLVVFSQQPWPEQAKVYAGYTERFEAAHGRSPGPLVTCDFTYVDDDPVRAEDLAREHIAANLLTVLRHYELMSDHFKDAKGYEFYGGNVDLMRAVGLEAICDVYLDVQAWGTPDDIIDKVRDRVRLIGDFDLNCCFRYAGLPFDAAERSMRLFAEKVMPVLRADAAALAPTP